MSNEFQTFRRAPTAIVAFVAAAVTLAASQAGLAAAAAKSAAPAAAAAAPTGEADKTLYALGVLLSRNLSAFDLTSAEIKIVEQGLTDGTAHHPALDPEAYATQVQTLERTRLGALDERQKAAGQALIDKVAALPGAKKTATGLVYVPILEGKGAVPDSSDRVSVMYEGKLSDGTVFDSTAKHGGQPVTLKVTGVIPCWSEALQLMKAGGKSRVICPAALAYGDRGSMPTILPGSALDFNIELVAILPKTESPPAAGATPTAPGTPGTPGATPPAGH
jgi:FKBP-type peptidyl-prolyl cis-trans isomerase FkpA